MAGSGRATLLARVARLFVAACIAMAGWDSATAQSLDGAAAEAGQSEAAGVVQDGTPQPVLPPAYAMDFIRGPAIGGAFGVAVGLQPPTNPAFVVAPSPAPVAAPVTAAGQVAGPLRGRARREVGGAAVAAGGAAGASVAGGGGAGTAVPQPVTVHGIEDLMGQVVATGGVGARPMAGVLPGVAPVPVQPSAVAAAPVQVPAAGAAGTCAGNGLETILSAECLRRLSPVPPGVAAVAGILPGAAVQGAGTGMTPVAMPMTPVMIGIGCNVTNAAGNWSQFRAANEAECLNGAVAMMPEVGRISVMMVDQLGKTAGAQCWKAVPGVRPSCVAN